MFIVRHKNEMIRFGLFLALVALMVYYLASRTELWRSSKAEVRQEQPAAKSAVPRAGEQDIRKVQDGAGFFAQYRIDREQQRSARQEELNQMVSNPNVDAEVKKAAAEELRLVQRYAALESQAETMVRAKGFADAVVMLSDSGAQVIVKGADLTAQQTMQVLDTVSRVTGVKSGAIQVTTKGR